MTATTSRWTGLGGVLLITIGVVVGVQACGVENPMGPETLAPEETPAQVERGIQETPAQVEHDVQEAITEEPTFTPFTVAPSILNRQEVIEAFPHRPRWGGSIRPRRQDLRTHRTRRGGDPRGSSVPVLAGVERRQEGGRLGLLSHHVPGSLIGSL
jgi:hypothetical protein